MKRRRTLYACEPRNEEINISPLIDIVFILLIFFIVTTVFVEETGVEVRRPKAVSAADLERHAILIAITAEGKVMHAGREIGVHGVRGTVSRLMRQEERPVVLRVDKSVSIDLYTQVHDAALLGGAQRVNLATLSDG